MTNGLVFDWLLSYKMIGAHPDHMALRERNEARLAILKQEGKLYESSTERLPTSRDGTATSASPASATERSGGQLSVVYYR